MSRLNKPAFTLLAAAISLAGCNTANIQQSQSDVEKLSSDMSVQMNQARSGFQERPASAVVVRNGTYLTSQTIRLPNENRPGLAAERRSITVNRTFGSLEEIAERITQLTGIPVLVEQDALEQLKENDDLTDDAAEDGPMTAPYVPLQSPEQPSTTTAKRINIAYSGPLSGLMDTVASRFGVFWGWDGKAEKLRLFRSDTRTFRIAALMGNTSLTSKVGSQGNSGSGSTGMELSSGTSFDGLSIWEGIESSIETMLSKNGKMSVTPATGTVTISDNPSVLDKVEAFVRGQNDALTRQVTLNVRVLSVTMSDEDNYGINWSTAFSQAGDFAVNYTTGFAAATNAATMVLSNQNADSRWNGSEAVINALSERGRVSQVTSAVVTTLNNQLIPLRVGKNKGYVSNATVTVDDGITTAAIETETLSTGFSMNLLPHIIDNDSLLVQFDADISALLEMGTFQSGDTTVQIPETENRNIHQRVRLNSGDTLVVAGFEQLDTSANKAGIGSPDNTWAGGGVSGNRGRTAIVVLVQPIIAQ